jgi:hypothetical protein
MIVHERHGKNLVDSTNWSGYAVTGANGSVSDVRGSWIVPSANCSNSPSTSYASFWVGIDGYSSNTVEQIGTDSDCESGQPTYYVWFEFYPHWSYTVNSVPLKSGDKVSAEVKYTANGKFTASITNESTNQYFSTSTKMNNAARSSAEWIIEAPWSGGVLPLADFTSVSNGYDYTAQSATCDATVGSTNAPIGNFGSNSVQIAMVSSSGATKSQPSALSSDNSSFIDTWYSAGP